MYRFEGVSITRRSFPDANEKQKNESRGEQKRSLNTNYACYASKLSFDAHNTASTCRQKNVKNI